MTTTDYEEIMLLLKYGGPTWALPIFRIANNLLEMEKLLD